MRKAERSVSKQGHLQPPRDVPIHKIHFCKYSSIQIVFLFLLDRYRRRIHSIFGVLSCESIVDVLLRKRFHFMVTGAGRPGIKVNDINVAETHDAEHWMTDQRFHGCGLVQFCRSAVRI